MDHRWFYANPLYPVPIRFSGNFIAADSCYASRTYGAAGNRRTFGLSCWVKKATLASPQVLFQARGAGTAKTDVFLDMSSDNKIRVIDGSGLDVVCDTALTSTSLWRHVAIAVDTTLATATDRVKIWVQGVQSSVTILTQVIQNYECQMNNNVLHILGARQTDAGSKESYLNGLVAAFYVMDGYAPTAADFGQLSPSDGVTWVPKLPSITIGTQGANLDFALSGNLGHDVSANGNDFATSGMTAANQSTTTPTNP